MNEVSPLPLFEVITKLLVLAPQLFVSLTCLYYLIRKLSIDSFLLTIGSFLSFICSLTTVLILPALISLDMENIPMYFTLIAALGFVANILFAIGLLVLVNRYLNKLNTNNKF